MGNDSFIEKLKSPIIRNEIIKTLQAIDVKSIRAVADIINNILDVQLVDADVKKVKAEIIILLDLFKLGLK